MLIFKEMRCENLIKLSLNYIKIKIIKATGLWRGCGRTVAKQLNDCGEAAEGLWRGCGRTAARLQPELNQD